MDKSGSKLIHGGGTLIEKKMRTGLLLVIRLPILLVEPIIWCPMAMTNLMKEKAKLIIEPINWKDGWPSIDL